MRKKSKEDEQTLEELNSAHRRSQAKCRLKQTSYIEEGREGVKWELGFAFFRGWEMGFCALGLGFMKK